MLSSNLFLQQPRSPPRNILDYWQILAGAWLGGFGVTGCVKLEKTGALRDRASGYAVDCRHGPSALRPQNLL